MRNRCMAWAFTGCGAPDSTRSACAPGTLTLLDASSQQTKKYSVAVTAHSTYLPDQSDEDEDRYVFAYTITHHQHRQGDRAARQPPLDHHRLRTTRCRKCAAWAWSAQQPVLKPGDTFEYTSGIVDPDARSARCAAATRWWPRTARASRRSIPEFTLSVPRLRHSTHAALARPGPPDDDSSGQRNARFENRIHPPDSMRFASWSRDDAMIRRLALDCSAWLPRCRRLRDRARPVTAVHRPRRPNVPAARFPRACSRAQANVPEPASFAELPMVLGNVRRLARPPRACLQPAAAAHRR